jgi:hypothetical protein
VSAVLYLFSRALAFLTVIAITAYIVCCYDPNADPNDSQWDDDENFRP